MKSRQDRHRESAEVLVRRDRGLARLRCGAKALEGLVDEFVGEAPVERQPADE